MRPCKTHHNVLLKQGQQCHKCINLKRNREKANKKQKGPRPYDKQAWRKAGGIRQGKLLMDPLCEDCKDKGLIIQASHVDHIDGDNTNHMATNLRSLCVSCHSTKTVQHDGGFGYKVNRKG